jgi:spore coat polysaccharide biosynthesis predicted glycosyltransferase SpsG
MSKRVLIAPLDWGLGHTARCIPIIQELLHQGHEVIFAGTKKQFDFMSRSIKLASSMLNCLATNVNYAKAFAAMGENRGSGKQA